MNSPPPPPLGHFPKISLFFLVTPPLPDKICSISALWERGRLGKL